VIAMHAALQIDRLALAQQIKQMGRALGFDLVGIAPARPSRWQSYFRKWLDEGQAGEMAYLAGRFSERVDPGAYLPNARSVICAAMNYYVPLETPNRATLSYPLSLREKVGVKGVAEAPPTSPHPNPLPQGEGERGVFGRVARYALGDDYHELFKLRLHELADRIREMVPDAVTRACVDTAPVMEKELAARAGIGWLGKNVCLINPRIGSWLLLGEIVTTLELPPDEPESDHCGTCTRCIDACPTGAITAPYRLDARRCISYLTIEHRGPIEPELQARMGNWLYGCDVCQDVCPHNSKAPVATDPALQPRFSTGTLDVQEVLNWTEQDYRETLRGTAMKRVKLPMLKRNARIVAENS
jgi:epoxyqueuosine reductase